MEWLSNIFAGSSGARGYTVEELSSSEALQSGDIDKRYLANILHSMQGETGSFLKQYASDHDIRIATSEDLPFRIGEYNPQTKTVTLEIPIGLEQHFDEVILTGRRTMYEELDHAWRVNSHYSTFTGGDLSGEDHVDGLRTTLEAIARVAAFKGMSEDAEIGSAPPLPQQFGVPESGEAIYYSAYDPNMVDAFLAGVSKLPEGQLPHEASELLEGVFEGFYDTSTSEWYALEYASQILGGNDTLKEYDFRKPLSAVLQDHHNGRTYAQKDLNKMTVMPGEEKSLGEGMRKKFAEGLFTAEAEKLTLRDLLIHRRNHVGTDGPHNPLIKTRSGGDFFRQGSPQELAKALETQTVNMERLAGFFRRCSSADYIPEKTRNAMSELNTILTGLLPSTRSAHNETMGLLIGKTDLTLQERLAVKEQHGVVHEIIYPLSKTRVDIHEAYVRGQSRQCTYVNSWGSP